MREMKYSGIEWIGDIPQSWCVSRIKPCLIEINDSNNPIKSSQVLSLNNKGEIMPYEDRGSQGNKAKESLSEYKLAYPNTIVANSMNILIGSVGISQYFGCVSPVYYVFRSSDIADLRYLNYVFSNTGFQKELRKFANGIMEIRLRVSSHDLLRLHIPLPPIESQTRISTSLDSKCIKLNQAIKRSNASIDEYRKLKQSIITKAITQGVRGSRPMKDSGSIWFGNIPTDWCMKKLKYIFSIKKDIAGNDGYQVLAITQKGILPKNMKEQGQFAENYSNYQFVVPGDFAMNHMDLLTGWVDISKFYGVTSPDYRVFGLKEKEAYFDQYYLYLMQMCYFNRIFYGLGQGVSGMGRWRLQSDKFLNFPIVVPPIDEQKEIANYLNIKCKEVDILIESKQKFVEELESYKRSLIYEYVTGKKEDE